MKALKLIAVLLTIAVTPYLSLAGDMKNPPIVVYEQTPLLMGNLIASYDGMTAASSYTPPAGTTEVNADYVGQRTVREGNRTRTSFEYDLVDQNGNSIGGCTAELTEFPNGRSFSLKVH